ISDPSAHNRPLCTYPLAFVACKKIQFDKKVVSLEDIARWPIITFSRNTQPYVLMRELFTRAGLRTTIHASASLATVVRMALHGHRRLVQPPRHSPQCRAARAAARAKDQAEAAAAQFCRELAFDTRQLCRPEGRRDCDRGGQGQCLSISRFYRSPLQNPIGHYHLVERI